MPRPKQSRNARLQVKPTAAAVAALAPAAVRAEREESTETDIYGHSDREHERLRQVQQRQREAAAAGARATQPVPDQTRTHAGSDTSSTLSAGGPAETRTRQTRPQVGPLKRLTDPLGSTATSTSEKGAAVRPGRGGDGSRRVAATPLALRDFSGLEIPNSDGFGNIDASFEDGEEGEPRGRTVANAGSAPGLRHRHRRGSSVNRPGDAPIRPTSRGLATPNISSTFNIGAFRRRAREPSILATARKERQSDSVVVDADSADADSDTSLDRNTSSARSGGRGGVATPPPAAGKKRKSSEGHPAGDRAEKSIRIDPSRLVADESSSSDLSTPVSPLAVLPPLIYDRPRPATPVRPGLETIAPPVSGGSNDSALWPDMRALGKHRRRRLTHAAPPKNGAGADDDLDDDISSLPSLTHSPDLRPAAKAAATRARNRAAAAAAAKSQPSPRVTTAELTSLLPTRRPKRTRGSDHEDNEDEDSEQLDVSTLGPDDDELSYLDTRAGRRARTRRGGALVKGKAAAKAAKKTAGKAKKQGAASISRTYGSRRDNDDDDDDEEGGGGGGSAGLPQSTPDHPVHSGGTGRASGHGEEISNAIKKFREVDQWELTFEEAVGSSSPANVR